MSDAPIHVVKLGGSLLAPAPGGLREMIERFETWRRAEMGPRGLLVVGGAAAADAVREWDEAFGLDAAAAHWLGIRAMEFNTRCVAAVVRGCEVVAKPQAAQEACGRGLLAVVDPLAWLGREEAEGVHIPHRWTFTSDSIAAHIATRLGAGRLTLLKSALPPGDCTPARAAELGIVDADFPEASKAVPAVELVNLRVQPFERCVL